MRFSIGSRAAAAAAVSTLLLGSLPATSSAHKTKLESIIEIDAYLATGAFLGSVGSFESKRCKRFRKVTLWRINPGAQFGPFGTTKTDKSGNWRIDVNAPPGTYFATVKKKVVVRTKKHRHICVADRSSNFAIGSF